MLRSMGFRSYIPLALLLSAAAVPLAAQRAIPGLDASAVDTTVHPGDNFYKYANGNWDRRTQIPPELSAFGSFNIAARNADANLMEIVHRAAGAHAPAGSDARKIADFYHAYLDTAALAARGTTPIRPLLDTIEAIAGKQALASFLGAHLRADVDPMNNGILHTDNPLGLWVAQDFNHPGHNVAFLLQGGLEMPDRSYYLDSSANLTTVRAQYRDHVARMLALANLPDPQAKADSIIALETRIARVHWNVEDSEDPAKGNNHWARADFARKAPGLDWAAYFAAAQLSPGDSLVAWQPSAIAGIAALAGSESLASWRALLAYHAIEDH